MRPKEIGENGFKNRIIKMNSVLLEILNKDVANRHVFISNGNRKTGVIPSVSLLPVIDCGNCKICSHMCYDLRNDCFMNTVVATRATNSAIYRNDPQRYFDEIDAWLTINYPRAFRWHIGGDIKDAFYLEQMIRIAEKFSDIKFLAFTKMFDLVNEYHERIPANLHIIFSGWVGQKMNNEFGFPSSHPLFADGKTSAHDGAKLCTGNCTECLKENRLCWNLGANEEVVFPVH